MAGDDVEVMVDDLLDRGLAKVGRARNLVDLIRGLAWTIAGLVAVGAVGLAVGSTSADSDGATLAGLALYSALSGLVLVVLLLGVAMLIDLSAARFELALWQSPLFEEDEGPEG